MKKIIASAAASVVLGAGVALAQPGTVGYTYGIQNCGAAFTNTQAACLTCCRSAFYAGNLSVNEWPSTGTRIFEAIVLTIYGWF